MTKESPFLCSSNSTAKAYEDWEKEYKTLVNQLGQQQQQQLEDNGSTDHVQVCIFQS